ncbi:hypothetical protein DPMN_103937 [Dreissena polymorpha]|uniref:Uncharacterized protein n=1 Tax=Dreissena polymorpha TaxID=45954 RepID=A0A9D4K0N9_DREPO|nr:hypothetical protein DPMN_103937 [Dreissena polymorpha]
MVILQMQGISQLLQYSVGRQILCNPPITPGLDRTGSIGDGIYGNGGGLLKTVKSTLTGIGK